MSWSIARDTRGRFNSIGFEGSRRNAWIGVGGLGFGSGLVTYNSHWYDLRHPRQRYSGGPTRFAFFWNHLWRGLCAFAHGTPYSD